MTSKKQNNEDWMPRCETCAFLVAEKKEDFGECHRLPPSVVLEEEGSISFCFAIVGKDQWCGEFKRVTN
jgi:hypothetical protein